MIHYIDYAYPLQIVLMFVSFIFMSSVLKEQWLRYLNTHTAYLKSRRILLTLVTLIFIGNFSHLEKGHLIHSVLLALVSVTWWYWYRIVAEELLDKNKLADSLKRLTEDLAAKALATEAQLRSAQIHQESQSEAIAQLPSKVQQKVNDLTAVKNIEKVAELNKETDSDII